MLPAPLRLASWMEVPHTGWVRLRQLGLQCFVEHRGTGEVARLQGRWALLFHNDRAYLGPAGDEPGDEREARWVNDLFDRSLHMCPTAAGGDALAVKSKADDTTRWATSCQIEKRPLVCRCTAAGVPGLCVAVWAYTCCLDTHGCILYWELPYLQAALSGNCMHGKWAMRHWTRWGSLIEQLGLSRSHLQKNHKALKAGAKHAPEGLDNDTYLAAVHEHCVSTQGMFVVLASLAKPHRKVSKDMSLAVLRVLGLIIQTFMGSHTCQVMLLEAGAGFDPYPEGVELDITRGKFGLQQLSDSRALPQALIKSMLGSCTTEQKVSKEIPLEALIVALGREAMKPSASAIVKAALCSITAGVAGIIEIQRGEPVWTSAKPTDLPSLFAKGKRRRSSQHLRRFIMKRVASDKRVKSHQQAIAGASLCGPGPNEDGVVHAGMSGCSTKHWDWQEMYQYLASCRMSFSTAGPLVISMDATRLGGSEVLYLAAFSTGIMQGAWLPAQVLWGTLTFPCLPCMV